jgi:putative transposase
MRVVEQQSPRPTRKRLRLVDFDYSTPGCYFVTVCVLKRRCLLGEIREGDMVLNALGRLVSDTWQQGPQRHDGIVLDEFVVMPNHIHALLMLPASPPQSLSDIVRAFKSLSSVAAYRAGMLADAKLWQRGFHDHVVRDEGSIDRLREYIANNPLKWHLDRENPANILPAAGRAGTSPAPTG